MPEFFKLPVSMILALISNVLLVLLINFICTSCNFCFYLTRVNGSIGIPNLNYINYLSEYYWSNLGFFLVFSILIFPLISLIIFPLIFAISTFLFFRFFSKI